MLLLLDLIALTFPFPKGLVHKRLPFFLVPKLTLLLFTVSAPCTRVGLDVPDLNAINFQLPLIV